MKLTCVLFVLAASAPAAFARPHDCGALGPAAPTSVAFDHWAALAATLPAGGYDVDPTLLRMHVEEALSFSQAAAVCPFVPSLQLPPGWYRGDTHVHVQGCSVALAQTPGYDPLTPDITFDTLLEAMPVFDLSAASVLLWGWTFLTPAEFLTNYGLNTADDLAPGEEHPVTVPHLDRHLQTGMETSGFSISMWGHQIGLGIGEEQTNIFRERAGQEPIFDAAGAEVPYSWWNTTPPVDPVRPGQYVNDGSGRVSERAFRIFKEAPGAVTGWAHQIWPVGYYADCLGFDWESVTPPLGSDLKGGFATGRDMAFPLPQMMKGSVRTPVLGPFDFARGWADFLEAFLLIESVEPSSCQGMLAPLKERWYGMYYKLLTAGQSVSIAGGTDAPCSASFSPTCPPITSARANVGPGQDFPYDQWLRSVRDGRVSLATSAHQFLELDVSLPDGSRVVGPGSALYLDSGAFPSCGSGACVEVEARYHFDPGGITSSQIAVEIVVDGDEANTLVKTFPVATTVSPAVFTTRVVLDGSSWIAARTGYFDDDPVADRTTTAHTAAARAFVDGKPIADMEAAEYWMLYADYVVHQIDELADEAALLRDPLLFDLWVGSDRDEQEIRDYVAAGRRVFRAVRDYDFGLDSYLGASLVPGIPSTHPDATTPAYPIGTSPAPMGITVDGDPLASSGLPLTVTGFNAPRNRQAVLVWGFAMKSVPDMVPGAEIWVDIFDINQSILMNSGQAGFLEYSFTPATGSVPVSVFMQYVVGDDVPGYFVASEVIELTVPL